MIEKQLKSQYENGNDDTFSYFGKYIMITENLKWLQYLFLGQKVDGFHNSMIDVLACLRCFVKMKYNYDDTKIL